MEKTTCLKTVMTKPFSWTELLRDHNHEASFAISTTARVDIRIEVICPFHAVLPHGFLQHYKLWPVLRRLGTKPLFDLLKPQSRKTTTVPTQNGNTRCGAGRRSSSQLTRSILRIAAGYYPSTPIQCPAFGAASGSSNGPAKSSFANAVPSVRFVFSMGPNFRALQSRTKLRL